MKHGAIILDAMKGRNISQQKKRRGVSKQENQANASQQPKTLKTKNKNGKQQKSK